MSSSETEDGGSATGQGTGSSAPNAIIEQDLIAGVASPISKSTSFRFLGLPKELRDKVYEGLLRPHIDGAKYQGFTSVRDYGLQPAILRTNKQIHKEASEILYKQNRTAIITLDNDTLTELKKNGFRWALPVALVKHGKVGALPMLTMDLTVHSERNASSAETAASKGEANERRVFIGFLSAVYCICRHVTYCGSADQLRLAVRLERPVGESILEELLDPFREVRGIRRAIITGIQLSSPMELTTLMETPIEHPNELFERANVYKSRARRQMREQKWNEARDTLENALESVSEAWFLRWSLEDWDMKKALSSTS